MSESKKFRAESALPEGLTEKDKQLNKLSENFIQVSDALHADSYMLVIPADSEIPNEHADVRTEVLGSVKNEIATLSRLVTEIEKAAGIIDVQPERERLES